MFQTKCVDDVKTQILCSINIFQSAVYEVMWETHGAARQVGDGNII
jgi:hypothetical protein